MGMPRWVHRPVALLFIVSGICQFALSLCIDASEDVNTSFGKVLYKQRHELNTPAVCPFSLKYRKIYKKYKF